MRDRARWLAVLAGVLVAVAACGGTGRGSSPAALEPRASPRAAISPSALYRIALPPSPKGPTTCTVYEPGFGTQIIVDSRSLDVRAQCEVWAANQPGGGYLWGYEEAAAMPDALRLCSLTDPHGNLTASVIEDTGFVPVSSVQRAKGISACADIRAAGWTDHRQGAGRGHRSARPGRAKS